MKGATTDALQPATERRPPDRRTFAKALALGVGALALPALRAQPQKPKTLKIGCATLAWNVSPTATDNFELALKDISELGYWGFETVSPMIEALDPDGALARLIDKYHLPMKSGYMDINITDPALRKDNLANVVRVARLVKKYGGTYVVMAANGRRTPGAGRGAGPGRGAPPPDTFHYLEHKTDMVAALNEYGMAVADLGLRAGLHQHTGTVVENHDEVYGIMQAVDPRYMSFAPDVGQLQKGGSDAAQVIKDFAKITTHMHLKDFSNGKYMSGYCPLGMGVVDIESILNTMEEAGNNPDVIHELDRGNAPISARETAAFSKAYLIRLGYKFQS
jgi:inosose dehydratase